MGLFDKNKKCKQAKCIEFDPYEKVFDRIYRYPVVGIEFEKDNGKNGQTNIHEVVNKVNGFYACQLVATKFQGSPAVKVYLKDGSDRPVHVGWLAAHTAKERIKMMKDGAELLAYVEYDLEQKRYNMDMYFYWYE